MPTNTLEDVFLSGLKDGSVVVNRLNTSITPTAAGHVQVKSTGQLLFWDATNSVIKKALSVNDSTDIIALTGTGAPTSGGAGTGVGLAGTGSTYTRTSNGATYVNTNTKASPTWTLMGTAASAVLTSAHLLVGDGANIAQDVAASGDVTLANTGAFSVVQVQTAAAPVGAGDVQIATNDFKWYGSGLAAAQTAKKLGDEVASIFEAPQVQSICTTSTSTAAVITRNAQGDRSWNRTAGAAETHHFSVSVPRKIQTASRGLKLTGVTVAYQLGVVDATSVDLVVDQVTYVQATAPLVAAHGGAVVDGDYDANHNTANKRKDSTVASGEHVLTLTLNTPVYNVTAGRFVEIELAVVLANTGTLKVRKIVPIYTQSEA